MSSSGWMWLFAGCAVTVGIVAAVKYSSKDEAKVRGYTQGVDLDAVLDTFKSSGGAKDLKQFEDALNARQLYPGGYVTTSWDTRKPAVLGFVDKNANRLYEPGVDQFVFRLEIERPGQNEYRVIATDGYYYRHHSLIGDIATMYLASSIVSALWMRHYTVYGMAPRVVYTGYSYAPRGYYRSPSYSRGTWGGRSTGGRVGGK